MGQQDRRGDQSKHRYYTADEMVGRVSGSEAEHYPEEDTPGPGGGGERVRKKKRRSHQPIYTQRRLRTLRNVALILFPVLFVGLVAVVFFGVRGYYEGESYISKLEQQLRSESGLDIKIEGLTWAGREVSIDRVVVPDRSESGGIVRSMVLDRVSGTVPLSSWWTKRWEVTDVKVGSVVVKLGVAGSGFSRGETTWKPGERGFIFNVASIGKAEIDFGGELFLSGGELVVRRTKGKGDLQIATAGGVLRLPSIPPLSLGDGSAVLSGGVLQIKRIGFTLGDGGAVESLVGLLPGEMEGAVSALDGVSDLKLGLRGGNLGAMLAAGWKERLSGELEGAFRYRNTQGQGAATLEGTFAVKGGRYVPHPTLQRIAEATGDLALSDIRFDRDITGQLLLGAHEVRIKDLDVDQRGVLSMRGDVRWEREGGGLEGRLKIGIAPDTIQRFPGGAPAFFTPIGERNFCWTEVEVGGTLDGVTNSLLPRLRAAGVVRAVP